MRCFDNCSAPSGVRKATRREHEALRSGLSRIEVLVGVGVLLIGGCLLVPWVLHAREAARRSRCAAQMGALTEALAGYEAVQTTLPAAAVWDTSALHSLALHDSARWDLFIGRNWAVELLPHLGREELLTGYDEDHPVSADANRSLRERRLEFFSCPADAFNRPDNRFRFESAPGRFVEFARGNYAVNGGTHSFYTNAGSTTTPTGDHAHLEIDVPARRFRYWGNGIAGFNQAFRRDEFTNGASTLVAFNEVRAGIDPLDVRGCWALGHIAGSVTWGHGINGDAYGPNNPWARSDDIQGCAALNKKYGPEKLIELGMPCVSYIDKNQNAASRSSHPGGVNTAFLDGSVRFVSDAIDPAVWHTLHSRETPKKEFHADVAELVRWQGSDEHAPPPNRNVRSTQPDRVTNSLGMEFVRIPAGEFLMGLPDLGNDRDTPPETPPHTVQLTNSYLLGTREVTREQFQAVMGEDAVGDDANTGEPTRPIVDVTWRQAVEFCGRLSALPSEVSAGRSYRLPTEAEWEYACRETKSQPYVWSGNRADGDETGDAAGIRPPLPLAGVGSYPPNELGFYDMRGNAWEWCADWFDRDYYLRSRLEDPAGPRQGYAKVVRGGDWIYVGENCFINYPILAPWKSSPFIGFRVVCQVAE